MSDTQQILFSMIGVGRFHPPDRHVLRDISLSFYYGAKIGVLGLNGAGKSSLLRIMAGEDDGYTGQIVIDKGVTRGMLHQEPALDDAKTVRQVVEEAVKPVIDLLAEYDVLSGRFAEELSGDEMDALIETQAKLGQRIEAVDGWSLAGRLEHAMDALRCPPPETPIRVLSGGERRRVALCRLLLTEPDILLLDEPTNHLDAESVQWLERHLQQYKGTVIAVTHDRYFLDNVAQWILELDRGHGIPWRGNYTSWLEQKQARLANEAKADSRRQQTLARELEWIRMAPKARHAKGKARVTAYERMLGEEGERERTDLEIYIPPGPRLGDVVITFDGVTKAFGDKLLFEDLSFMIPPGCIVGVIGPNGAGKTTMLELITGEDVPDAGTVTVGETVKLAYVDQSRAHLAADETVWQAITEGDEYLQLGPRTVNSRGYVSGFNFMGSDQQKKVGVLSGGERNRVNLARMLRSGANVLLLDEPTNDLDLNTLRALEEAIEQFAGCAVIVSHDRWFLDRVATHILAFEGDSVVCWFEGNFQDYEADRRRRLGTAADTPHRIRYRSLTRG
ncbi:MAG: energy-dependent translational throttle protein EttA [Ardenticatenales bacterium]|nr:energy-dependent translational throttle protein EttA [Ardenticatenales bacterium]